MAGQRRKAVYALETALACPGQCPGCMIPATLRRGREPAMPTDRVDQALAAFGRQITDLGDIHSVEFNCGIADHMILGGDYLASLYDRFLGLCDTPGLTNEDSEFEFTTALYGSEAKLLATLERMARAAEGRLPIKPVVVIDPTLRRVAPKLWREQQAMLAKALQVFGNPVDVAINLSLQAVDAMTPAEMFDLFLDRAVPEFKVNWVPTAGNLADTAAELDRIEDWLIAYMQLAADSAFPQNAELISVTRSLLEGADQGLGDDADLTEHLTAVCRRHVPAHLFVTADGSVSALMEAVGDIPFHPAQGLVPVAHLDQGPLQPQIERAIPRLVATLVRGVSRPACGACPHRLACAGSAYPAYAHVLRKAGSRPDRCPHPGRRVFDTAERLGRIDKDFLDADTRANTRQVMAHWHRHMGASAPEGGVT